MHTQWKSQMIKNFDRIYQTDRPNRPQTKIKYEEGLAFTF